MKKGEEVREVLGGKVEDGEDGEEEEEKGKRRKKRRLRLTHPVGNTVTDLIKGHFFIYFFILINHTKADR